MARFHWHVTLMSGLAFAGNGVDLGVISFSMPGFRDEWGLSAGELAFMLPCISLGQVVGALLMGGIADRLGRRVAFCTTSVVAGAATGLAGLASGPVMMSALLFLGGIGFGGVAPSASSLVSEFAPPAHRGKMMAWTQVLWVTGWCIAAFGGGWFAQQLGWRGILGIGALPVLTGLMALWTVPESPRFLAARGRHEAADRLVAELKRRHGVHVAVGSGGARPVPSQRAGLSELWSRPYRRRTLVIWTTWPAMTAAYAGPMMWLPVLLGELGEAALQISAFVALTMFPATLISANRIDHSGRKPLMVASLGAAALGALLLSVGTGPVVVIAGAIGIAAGTIAAWPVVLSWASELYPTRMRATAAGWGSGVARAGGVFAPVVLGSLMVDESVGRQLAMAPFAVLLGGAVLSVVLFAEETAGRSLEEISQ
ncbi:MAG: MFS transporter [Chloroflexota bacterium]